MGKENNAEQTPLRSVSRTGLICREKLQDKD